MSFFEKDYVRLNKIEFTDFRNIEYGVVEFPNSSYKDYLCNKPSILGLYGQNGSGKTSVIMALSILKNILSGETIKSKSCIRQGCDRCKLCFTFMMYGNYTDENGEAVISKEFLSCYEVFYSFEICQGADNPAIENEILEFKGIFNTGKVIIPKQTFIDTTGFFSKNSNKLFGSDKKEKIYTCKSAKIMKRYHQILSNAHITGRSFIFCHQTHEILLKILKPELEKADAILQENITQYFDIIEDPDTKAELDEVLKEVDVESVIKSQLSSQHDLAQTIDPLLIIIALTQFGVNYLHVIDTAMTGVTNINSQLPLLLWINQINQDVHNFNIPLQMDKETPVPEEQFLYVKKALNRVSDVLEKIVPGIRLTLNDLGITSEDDRLLHCFELTSQRNGIVLPLKYESDGIRRIISILSLLIAAYNDESFTIAIDEIDSGIFEFLLGEILSVLSKSMKGQLIFTSHNLRPLEVLPAKFICFTTAEPKKRFTTITRRGNSNLRDIYYRTIILNTQNEPIYNSTDNYEIELALYRAGHACAEE